MMLPQGVPETHRDSLRSALDSVFTAPAFRWETRADPYGPLRRAWDAVRAWFDRMGTESPLTVDVLVVLLALLVVAIFFYAGRVVLLSIRGGKAGSDVGEIHASPPRDAVWYRAEADKLADAGRYAEAMQADFLRLVLELDARSITRFHPSRTPNEYVRTAALTEEGRRELRDLVGSLYAYAFAGRPCDRDAFDAWRVRAQSGRYATAI